jgi:hypothetical protein
MAFERIDRLVSKEGFCFQAWDDRYSKGVWVALGTNELEIDVVRDLSSAGDLDMFAATSYVFSADWLPYVTGNTLLEAMNALEERLASLPVDELKRGSNWFDMTYQALQYLLDAQFKSQNYGDLEVNIRQELPASFDEALTGHKRQLKK